MMQEKSAQAGSSSRSWIADAAIFVAVPAFAYLCTYAYELGYARFFGIPDEFVCIDTRRLIMALLSMIVPGFWLNHIIGFYHELPKEWHRSIMASPSAWLTALLFATIGIYGGKWHEWMWLLCVVLVIASVEFLVVRLRRLRRIGSLLTCDLLPTSPAMDYLNERIGIGIVMPVLVAAGIGCFFAYNCGRSAAMRKEEFLVTTKVPGIVLATYGDSLVCTTYDTRTHRIGGYFSVRKMGEDPSMRFAAQRIGPLAAGVGTPKRTTPMRSRRLRLGTETWGAIMGNLPAWLQAIGGLLLLCVTAYYAWLTRALVRATLGGKPVLGVTIGRMEITTERGRRMLLIDLSVNNHGTVVASNVRIDGAMELSEVRLVDGQVSPQDTFPAIPKYDAMISAVAACQTVKPPAGNALTFEDGVMTAVQQAWEIDALRDRSAENPDDPSPSSAKLCVYLYYDNAIGESFEATSAVYVKPSLSDRAGGTQRELAVVRDCGSTISRIRNGTAIANMLSRRKENG